jgi:hypothetical protein
MADGALAQVVPYEAPGNLKATNPLACVPATEVTTASTAVDVAAGAKACADNREFDRAAEMFMVVSALGFFDTQRVADQTAHEALAVLPRMAFGELSERRLQQVFAAIRAVDQDAARKQAICAHLKESPPPTYVPTYMIAHGMNALLDPEAEQLVADFDAVPAWSAAMKFVRCD